MSSIEMKKGFTFVEVLATLTFVAIVLPVIMKGISLSTVAASESRKRSEATILAQGKMSEIVSSNIFDFVEVSGDFMPENEDYSWNAELVGWEGESLKELIVKVLWTSRNEEHSVNLSTLVYMSSQVDVE